MISFLSFVLSKGFRLWEGQWPVFPLTFWHASRLLPPNPSSHLFASIHVCLWGEKEGFDTTSHLWLLNPPHTNQPLRHVWTLYAADILLSVVCRLLSQPVPCAAGECWYKPFQLQATRLSSVVSGALSMMSTEQTKPWPVFRIILPFLPLQSVPVL